MKFSAYAAAALIGLAPLPAFAATTTIHVRLWDKGIDPNPDMKLGMDMGGKISDATMGLKVDKTTVASGKVVFEVVNTSKQTTHEMIVVALKDTKSSLPYSANENRINEDVAGSLGEVPELDPGKSGTLTLDLKPGRYVVFCNVPAHYMNGMWQRIDVK